MMKVFQLKKKKNKPFDEVIDEQKKILWWRLQED